MGFMIKSKENMEIVIAGLILHKFLIILI